MKQIAFITDVHLNEQFPIDHNVNPGSNLEKVLSNVSGRNIEEIVFGGDIGDYSAHQYFFDALNPFSYKIILGNHDNFKEVEGHFNPDKTTGELYYKFEDDYFKFLYLDSSSEEVSDLQLNWLRSELTTRKKLILFIHHPVVEIETPIDRLYPLKNRERLRSILTENDIEINLFCGHYHMNDETIFKNIKQYTTQSLSFQIVKNADELKIDNLNFGYRIIKIEGDKIVTELVDFDAKAKNAVSEL